MGLFNRRVRVDEGDHLYVELRIYKWSVVRPFEERTTRADKDLGLAWLERIAELLQDDHERTRAESECHDRLRALTRAVVGLEGTPDDPRLLSLDFLHGWMLAGIEEVEGHAQPGGASMAALATLWLMEAAQVRAGNDFSLGRVKFREAGYFGRRMGLDPGTLVDRVSAGARPK